jgi:hypothetical protein
MHIRGFAIALVGLLAVGAATLAVLESQGEIDLFADEVKLGPGAALTGKPPQVLYLDGTQLKRYDIESGESQNLAELPPSAVTASPRTSFLAYVDEETGSEPTVHLYDAVSGSDESLGLGVSPLWHHSGARLAYLRPEDPATCLDLSCAGDVEVVVYDLVDKEEDVVAEAGRWSLLSWAEDYLLLGEAAERTVSVSLEGDQQTIDYAPSEIGVASPDGRWLIVRTAEGSAFVPLADGGVDGDPIPIPIEEGSLDAAVWSLDSSFAAAIQIGEGSQPVVTSPDEPSPKPVEEAFLATEPLVWSVTNNAVVVSRVIDAQAEEFEAFWCPVETQQTCEPLFSVSDRVVLLRTE